MTVRAAGGPSQDQAPEEQAPSPMRLESPRPAVLRGHWPRARRPGRVRRLVESWRSCHASLEMVSATSPSPAAGTPEGFLVLASGSPGLASVRRDMQPLLNALPSVGVFDPSFRGPGPQASGGSHQPPARVQGPPPSHWLAPPPRFPLLPGLAGLPQALPAPAQRSCAETSELREALLKIFPDSEQRLKIDQILVAHPYMKDLNALSAMVLD